MRTLRVRTSVGALGVGSLVALVAAFGLVGCQPVTPHAVVQHSTFEGFDVISYVPPNPTGLIYLFHGTGGSADIAEKVESVDVLNQFVDHGYGFVATSSTERTGDKRWNVSDPSLTTNSDLARLTRLQAHLVATTGVDASTPLFGIGMSNGSRFVTLWGQTWADAGYPVRAIWAASGRIAAPVTNAGGLTVPTFFTASANDFTVPADWTVADHAATAAKGTPAELHVSQERTLTALPYLRIPGVDATEANQIVAALQATGVWDGSGARVVPDIEAAVAQAQTAVLPASVRADGLGNEVADETALVLAVHQFSAEYKLQAWAFFEAHR